MSSVPKALPVSVLVSNVDLPVSVKSVTVSSAWSGVGSDVDQTTLYFCKSSESVSLSIVIVPVTPSGFAEILILGDAGVGISYVIKYFGTLPVLPASESSSRVIAPFVAQIPKSTCAPRREIRSKFGF